MLIKLLKHEFKFTGRMLLPIYITLLALSLLLKLGGVGFDGGFDQGLLPDFLVGVMLFAFGCVVSAVFVITVVLLVQRFYRNLLRDEGYLMHTLPVAAWQNILAKLLAAISWSVVSLLLPLLAILIINMDWETWRLFWQGLGMFIDDLNRAFGGHWLLFALETLALLLGWLGSSILRVYLALAIGHTFNNRKIFWSIGAYIGISIIGYLLDMTLGRSLLSWDWLVIRFDHGFDFYLQDQIVKIHTLLLLSLLYALGHAAVYFVGTNWLMKNKLNLE